MKSTQLTPGSRRILVFYGISLLFLSVLFIQESNAQCWQWAISAGGDIYESPRGISADPSGQIAVTGEFQGTAIFGDHTLVAGAGRDVFTVLLDSSGVILNAMGGVGDGTSNISNGVGSDAEGNVYIAGNFSGTITFGDTSLVSEGLLDVFLVKYDVSGNQVWARRAGGTSEIKANDIAVDADGNSYIVGDFYNTAAFGAYEVYSSSAQDVYTVKYDTDGNVTWAVSSGALGTDNGLGIAVDPSGNVYITGLYQSEYSFGDTAFTSEGNRDGFISKYGPDGQPLWARSGGGWNNEFFNRVAVSPNGDHIFVTGEFESDTMMLDGLTLVNQNDAGIRRDIFLMDLDSEGTVRWGFATGSEDHDYSVDVAVDQNGDAYITGSFDQNISFGDHLLTNGSADIFLAKFSPAGEVIWARNPTLNTASGETFSVTTFMNRPIIAGDLAAGPAPPVLVFDNDTLISNGSLDLFVARLGPPCNEAPTALEEIEWNQFDLTVYPNPFGDLLQIRSDGPTAGPVEVRIYNAQGSLVHELLFSGSGTITVDTGHLQAGLYFLQIGTGSGSRLQKVIKTR